MERIAAAAARAFIKSPVMEDQALCKCRRIVRISFNDVVRIERNGCFGIRVRDLVSVVRRRLRPATTRSKTCRHQNKSSHILNKSVLNRGTQTRRSKPLQLNPVNKYGWRSVHAVTVSIGDVLRHFGQCFRAMPVAFELLDVHSEFFCISCKRSAIERVLITIHHLGYLEKLSLPSCGIAGKGRIYSVLVDLLVRKVAVDKLDVCTKFVDHLLHQRTKSGTSRTLKINKCNDGHLCS